VRLIRSKGVGVYFVTQNPRDVPDKVLAQLGNRVQHALRAFTPLEQKAVRLMAQTFRPNPEIDIEEVITQLGTGEALVSFLQADGTPGMVERAFVCPPESRIGGCTAEERNRVIQDSIHFGKYERVVDRESAHEMIRRRIEQKAAQAERPAPPERPYRAPQPRAPKQAPRRAAGRRGDSLGEAFAKSAARSIGSSLGRQILRGVLGSILGKR